MNAQEARQKASEINNAKINTCYKKVKEQIKW